MSNLCFTDYYIECKNKEQAIFVKKIFNILSNIKDVERLTETPNGWGDKWLGKLAYLFFDDINNVYCRGCVTDVQHYCDNVIKVSTKSAWEPCYELFSLIEKVLNVKIYAFSEALDIDIFETNDKEGKYIEYKYVYVGDDDNILDNPDLRYKKVLDLSDNPEDWLEIQYLE